MKKHEGPHRYFKTVFKQSGTEIFRCNLGDCPHFVYEQLILGRLSLCNRCGEVYTIIRKSIVRKKMHCENCTRGIYNKVKEVKVSILDQASEKSIDNIVDNLLNDLEKKKKSANI